MTRQKGKLLLSVSGDPDDADVHMHLRPAFLGASRRRKEALRESHMMPLLTPGVSEQWRMTRSRSHMGVHDGASR